MSIEQSETGPSVARKVKQSGLLRRLTVVVLVYVGVIAAFESIVAAAGSLLITDIGAPVLVVTTTTPDGTANSRALGRFESNGEVFVAANHWPRGWYCRAVENPNVKVEFECATSEHLAVPVTRDEHARLAREYIIPFIVRVLSGFPPRSFLRLEPK